MRTPPRTSGFFLRILCPALLCISTCSATVPLNRRIEHITVFDVATQSLNNRGDEQYAVDGDKATYSYLTPPGTVGAEAVAFDLGAIPINVNRIRVAKLGDDDGDSVIDRMNIEILWSADAGPLENRNYLRVSSMTNGYLGSERVVADKINSNGSVDNEHHDFASNGWFSLRFDTVAATTIAIRFERSPLDPYPFTHYPIYEAELYNDLDPSLTLLITSSAGPNGAISPKGSRTIGKGETASFTGIADAGFEIDKWLLDGTSVQSGGTFFSLTNAQVSHTVEATFKTSRPGYYSVMVVNVHGTTYNGDGFNLWSSLRSWGINALYVDLNSNGAVKSALATNNIEQLWIFDLSDSADNYPDDWKAIAEWFLANPLRGIICDARMISSYWFGRHDTEGKSLSRNYYENLRLVGGGLLLGTDHSVYQAGINEINRLIGLQPFNSEFATAQIPIDGRHPLMMFPQQLGSTLWDDSSPGQVPFGKQPNGRILYPVAWHGGSDLTPGISTSIPKTSGFRVHIVSPSDGSSFLAGVPVTFISTVEGAVSGIEYQWFEGRVLDNIGTTVTMTTSDLPVGDHIITVIATHGQEIALDSIGISVVEPTVRIVTPVNGAAFLAGTNITIAATVTNVPGVVTRVEFFQGQNLLGTASAFPFKATWPNVQPGQYTVTARAFADRGWSGTSAPVNISVVLPGECNVSQGLVAYYPLNGTAQDTSGNGINGSVHGAVPATDRFGLANGCFRFDGNGDYISAPADKLPRTRRSISLWFKANRVDNLPGFLGYGGSSCGDSFFLGLNHWGAGSFVVTTHCDAYTLSTPYTESPANAWHHWVLVMDDNGLRSYLDCKLIGSKSGTTQTYVAGTQLGLGVISSPGGAVPYTDGNVGYLDGYLDEVRIYNRPLAREEIDCLCGAIPPPTIAITRPIEGSIFKEGEPIAITAVAASNGAAVTNVVFFADGNELMRRAGPLGDSMYSFVWTAATVGSHILTAKAFDSQGLSSTSAPIRITVFSNTPPLISPVPDQATGESVPATAIDFIIGDAETPADALQLSVESSNLGLLPLTNVVFGGVASNRAVRLTPVGGQVGNTVVVVTVTDSGGLTAKTSFSLLVTNRLPIVTILSPTVGQGFTAPTNITIIAAAIDPGGTVAKVEFFAGSTKLGETKQVPHRVVWENVSPGTYTLSAVATDNRGATTRSTVVSIVVTETLPRIRIISPTDKTVVRYGDAIEIKTEVQSFSASIDHVEFYAGTSNIGEASAAPYGFLWPDAQTGDYFLTAKAVDRLGKTAQSDSVHVVVGDACGRVAIVRMTGDIETDKLEDALFELGVEWELVGRGEISFEKLRNFDLVIWNQTIQTTLSAAELQAFKQLVAIGKPLYLIGENLVQAADGLDWTGILHLRPFTPNTFPTEVILDTTTGHQVIVDGKVGTIKDFQYSFAAPLGLRNSDPGDSRVTVIARAGDSDVLVAFEDFLDAHQLRLLTQSFFVTSSGSTESRLERKKLFQNSVWWLLSCRQCATLGLHLESSELTGLEVGKPFIYTILLSHFGECDGLAVSVRGKLPPEISFIGARSEKGQWNYANGIVTFNIGRVGLGARESLEIIAVASRPGVFTNNISLSSLNETAGGLSDNDLPIVATVSGNALVLTAKPLDEGLLELIVFGPADLSCVIESSPDLAQWLPVHTNNLAGGQLILREKRDAEGKRFYRARSGI
jgi:hypothetical protein